MVGSLVLTALAAVLPAGAEFAHRQGMHSLKWAAWCAVPLALDSGKRELMAPDVFMDAMSEFCKGVGIRTKIEGAKLYLIDVELADTSRASRLGTMGREKRL